AVHVEQNVHRAPVRDRQLQPHALEQVQVGGRQPVEQRLGYVVRRCGGRGMRLGCHASRSSTSTGRSSRPTTNTRTRGFAPLPATTSSFQCGESTGRLAWAVISWSRRWPATTSKRRKATTSGTP